MADTHSAHGDPGSEQPGDGHGHGPVAGPLGPVDWAAWGYAVAGSLLGLIVLLALYLAREG